MSRISSYWYLEATRRFTAILAAVLIAGFTIEAAAQSASLWTTSFRDADSWQTHPSLYGTIEFPDVNGDDRADVCGRGYDGIYCALSNGASFGPTTLWSSEFSDANGWQLQESYYKTIQFPDVNGDGKADVCGRSSNGIYCARSNGSSFGANGSGGLYTSHFSNAGGWDAHPSYWDTIQFPDINGDGLADVCGRSAQGIRCGISWGSFFSNSFLSLASYTDAQSWQTDPSYWSTIQFPDLNGDGRADVCGRGSAGMWCALKKADYTTQFHDLTFWDYAYNSPWPSPDDVWSPWGNSWNFTDPAYYSTIQFADLNNDGKDDVCARAHFGMNCYITTFDRWAGGAGGFQQISYWWYSSVFTDANGWNQERFYRTIRLVDFDGDGFTDACGRGTQGIWCQRVAMAPTVANGVLEQPFFHDRYILVWMPQAQFVVANFGDNFGWGTSEAYWKTVDFADVDRDGRWEVCGRGSGGIWCGPN